MKFSFSLKLAVLMLLSTPAFALDAQKPWTSHLYGFIKASGSYADRAINSYSNINQSAQTSANARTRGQDSLSRFSMQVAQSRFGFELGKGDTTTGKMELDFIDFAKSSPTTQMVPRVRIASVTHNFDSKNKIIFGQDWDLFSPTTAYTFDIVGLFFQAGNSGFMRQQVQYLHNTASFELGVALGMAGNNPGVADTDLEYGKYPTMALRGTYQLDEKSKVGLSAIGTKLQYRSTNHRHANVYGINAFYEQVFSGLAIKGEAYTGQNLYNIGSLTLGKGTSTKDLREWGAHLSSVINLGEKNLWTIGLGQAQVTNKGDLSPYLIGATGTITDLGITRNFVSRTSYEYKWDTTLSWLAEVSRFATQTKLSTTTSTNLVAHTFETGVIYKF